jgi:hypothetical protein
MPASIQDSRLPSSEKPAGNFPIQADVVKRRFISLISLPYKRFTRIGAGAASLEIFPEASSGRNAGRSRERGVVQ